MDADSSLLYAVLGAEKPPYGAWHRRLHEHIQKLRAEGAGVSSVGHAAGHREETEAAEEKLAAFERDVAVQVAAGLILNVLGKQDAR